MKLRGDKLSLSATDLANHLGCRHLTMLDLRAARGDLSPPAWSDPALEVLQERGFEHEARYLEHLQTQGRDVHRVEPLEGQSAVEATMAAMRVGRDVIVQASLEAGPWRGRADILLRVNTPSELGDWSYEVVDTKLASETRAGTLLQLCLYSEIIAQWQGVTPTYMHVVSPSEELQPQTFRLSDHDAYHRLVKQRLAGAVSGADGDHGGTYPEPVDQCDICRWWSHCDKRRRQDDHLSLVAGISRLQRGELVTQGVCTLESLARMPLPLAWRPTRSSTDSYQRVREQARVQLEGRETEKPVYELLQREAERGLLRLPAPSAGDVFFDIEGDVFAAAGGLEYLFGWALLDGESEPEYRRYWALDAGQERAAFEAFIDEMMARLEQFPDLHIYHFAPYEPSAVKRLMGRYATREEEVDQLLRGGVFVDLHAVTKQAVRASVERYSIKDLEQFTGYSRVVELREASKNLHAFERALERGRPGQATGQVRELVQAYNRDDCLSTVILRDWLEGLRAELVEQGEDMTRPVSKTGDAPDDVAERQQRVNGLMARLLDGVPDERDSRTPGQQGCWLLAQLLGWHWREHKSTVFEFFRLSELSPEELMEERAGLSGLEFVNQVGGTARCPVHRYRFPSQDVELKEKDLRQSGGASLGTRVALNVRARTVDIKKRGDTANVHPSALFAHGSVRTEMLAESLLRLGEWVAEHGVDAPGSYRAARDLLLSRAPRLAPPLPEGESLLSVDEAPLDGARRLALGLSGGVLAIQGPPGAGKTYTGARMICALVAEGKRVGITANSHKVIRNLLDGVVEAAEELGVSLRCMQKINGTPAKDEGQPIIETKDTPKALAALDNGVVQVVGATAWSWASETMFEQVDVLVVDEAGQMALANALAVAAAADSMVLLGDPQQLEQPLQGSHPEGADASALQHLLDDKQTFPAERGLFLAETWRLHPSICQLTSELFYEERLASRRELAQQCLVGATPFAGAGLWYMPVDHDGNQNSSDEEANVVAELYEGLLNSGAGWVDANGDEKVLAPNDVLVVAPYNAQVGLILERLPHARVGTVDKFQGQEAPVVIYSMVTSTPADMPRGMEFSFSPHRLNVATSRARCACILVASPRLFEVDCRSPRQIQLANGYCRYLELAHQAPG